MTAVEVFLGEFDAIDAYLKAVRETVQQGHMPDMAGLDLRVSELCLAVQDAGQEAQQRCLPRLNELLKQLDECENEIRAFHEAATAKGAQ